MSPAGLALRVGAVPPSPRQVRAKDGDRQRGRGRLSLVCKPRDTVSDNPEYRGTVNDNLTATALLALPVGTPAVPGPRVPVACPAGQPEGGLFPKSCLQTGFYPVRPRCLSPRLLRGRVPLPGGQAGSTRSPRLQAGIPRLCARLALWAR